MTRITGTQQALLILRAQLERAQKTRAAAQPATPLAKRRTAADRIKALRATSDYADDKAYKVLIAALLGDQLGEEVAQDPAFHSTVDEVTRALMDDADTAALLAQALRELE